MVSEENGGSGVTDIMYFRCIEVIKSVRDLDSFTFALLKNICGLRRDVAGTTVDVLIDARCLKLDGRYSVNGKGQPVNHYTVDAYAITNLRKTKQKYDEKLKKEALKRKEAKEKKAYKALNANSANDDDLKSGIRFVKKAFIGDMGNQSIKHLDQLLTEVRA